MTTAVKQENPNYFNQDEKDLDDQVDEEKNVSIGDAPPKIKDERPITPSRSPSRLPSQNEDFEPEETGDEMEARPGMSQAQTPSRTPNTPGSRRYSTASTASLRSQQYRPSQRSDPQYYDMKKTPTSKKPSKKWGTRSKKEENTNEGDSEGVEGEDEEEEGKYAEGGDVTEGEESGEDEYFGDEDMEEDGEDEGFGEDGEGADKDKEDWMTLASQTASYLLSFLRFLLGPTFDEIIVDAINYGNIAVNGEEEEEDLDDEGEEEEEEDDYEEGESYTTRPGTWSGGRSMATSQSPRSNQYRRAMLDDSNKTSPRRRYSEGSDTSSMRRRKRGFWRTEEMDEEGSSPRSPRRTKPAEASGDRLKTSMKSGKTETPSSKSSKPYPTSGKDTGGKKTPRTWPRRKVSFHEGTGQDGEGSAAREYDTPKKGKARKLKGK